MTESEDKRPAIATITSAAELRRWYWLKSELVDEARRRGITVSGAKFTVLERLAHYLDSGDRQLPSDTRSPSTSTFDWQNETLSDATVITDNYKNTQNVRAWFADKNPAFKFNIALIDWFRSNVGKTLGDAYLFWQQQQNKRTPTDIKPHNQL